MSIQQAPAQPVILAPGEGKHLSFLNHLATIKHEAGSSGSMSVVEFTAPRGFGPPEHIHRHEDELFIILEGELRLYTGGEEIAAGEGSFAHLPRAVAHTFQVMSPSAHFMNVTASPSGPPRFDAMVATLGTAIPQAVLPEPGPIDPARVAEVCAAHGIDIVGPPPGGATG
ncbi:MAG: cupin domain-containing protein [Actinomycetota bacterium]